MELFLKRQNISEIKTKLHHARENNLNENVIISIKTGKQSRE